MLVVEAEMLTIGVTVAFTVMLIGVAVAVLVLIQVALLVITTETWLPLVNVEELKVELFVPAFEPLTNHW